MLHGHTIREVDSHLRMDHAPILPPPGPLPGDVHRGQIQHFQQAVVRWKYGFSLGHLPQLAVETLYGVGGVDQP